MSPKEDPKSSDGTVTVNIEEFSKTRDTVLLSLAQLQSAVSDLSRAYLNHTNTVLGRGSANFDLSHLTSNITNTLYESGLLGDSVPGDKRKRKRTTRPDPNAPKRALTPFFLYMQHNRGKIAEDLGPGAKPKDVSEEGTQRWSNLPESQKEVWRKLYADNLASYREKMAAYKAGLPVPDDDNVQAANQLQQGVAGAEASEGESEQSSEGESEDEGSPSPTKEPTPPRSGKRRRSDAKVAKEAAVTPKKDEEKKKRVSRKGRDEEPASTRKESGGDAKRSKKKRKSEAGGEE